MAERNYRAIINYEEAFQLCRRQESAKTILLEAKPTVAPNPEDESIIVCIAPVAFQQKSIGEDYVVGIPWPVCRECKMTPTPSCRTCEVARLGGDWKAQKKL